MLVTNMRSEHELCQCELWGASCLSVGTIWLKSATLTESAKLTILYIGSCYCTVYSNIFAVYFVEQNIQQNILEEVLAIL